MAAEAADLLHTAETALSSLDPGGEEPPTHAEVVAFLATIYDIGLAYGDDVYAFPPLEDFVTRTAADIERLSTSFLYYPGDLLTSAKGVWESDEWTQLCRRRSALAFFVSLYGGSDAWSVAKGAQKRAEPLDAYMRERGAIEGGFEEEEIDPAIPRSHWWWWLPSQP